ncbi:MAG: mechanosensitive ion channel family protein [Planctomycetota bacterium]
MNKEHLTVNLVTIASEVVALCLVLFVLYWIVSRLLRALEGSDRLAGSVRVVRRNARALFLVVGFVLVAAVIGLNAFWMYHGHNVLDRAREELEAVPMSFWIELGIGCAKSIGLAVAALIVLRWVRKLLGALCARAKAFEGIRANDESLDQLFSQLQRVTRRVTWLAVLAASAGFLGAPGSATEAILLALRVYLIVAAGLLIWRGLDAVIASLDALSKKYSSPDNLLRYYEKLTHLVPIFRRAIEYALYVTVATLVVLQISATADLAAWGPRLIKIIGTVFLARVVIEVANLVVEEVLLTRAELAPDQRQRRLTIIPLIRSALKYLIYFTAGIIVLKQLQVDPTPVLAGAGIITLAVGLGAQNLINDVVSGFFILFENYYLVGDYVSTAGAEGEVEAIDLRTTRIRDNEGRLHIIRNGKIEDVTNFSKQYTNAVVEVGVAYESDLDEVYAALEDVGKQIREASSDVLQPTVVAGLDNFGESELTIRTVTRVRPGKHLGVERKVRKLIKETFDARGIEIPYARRVLILQDAEGGDPWDRLRPSAAS